MALLNLKHPRSFHLSLMVGTLVFLGIPATIPAAFCHLPRALAHGAEFGEDGRDGRNGREGRNGRAGDDQAIWVDGRDRQLNLSGTDGTDGTDGDDADSPWCQSQPHRVNRNLNAADGGDGGDGGSGGDGGNGGSLTVYYTNPNDLGRIFVEAVGGDGGRAGRGGRGTRGCRCHYRRWTYKTCTTPKGTLKQECKSKEYSCRHGQDGHYGRDGRDGKQGQLGQLSLIQQTERLQPDKPNRTLKLATLNQTPVPLSLNRWRNRQGALTLLASGSQINDTYREFIGRQEGTFQLDWQADTAITDFTDQSVDLTLRDGDGIEAEFSEDLWVNGTPTQTGDLTTYVVTGAIHRNDVTRLAVADFVGKSRNIQLAVVDLAGKSDQLTTQFQIRYRTASEREGRRPFRYRTRYEGNIPASLVRRDFNRFTLDLGQLPIDTQHLIPGTAVELELLAIRSLGERSAEQKITWKGTL